MSLMDAFLTQPLLWSVTRHPAFHLRGIITPAPQSMWSTDGAGALTRRKPGASLARGIKKKSIKLGVVDATIKGSNNIRVNFMSNILS